MISWSWFSHGVQYLVCVTDVFTKYAWVNPLKDKKAKTIHHGFIEIVNESKPKPNKLWVDQRKEFYNNCLQKWLDNNDIWMYSTLNEGESVAVESSVRTWFYLG